MAFLSDKAEWIRARMTYIPAETAAFLGDISGLDILDVGCGDMVADIGLLSLGPKHVTGVDIHKCDHSVEKEAARDASSAGFTVPSDYASRLSYTAYDGRALPFADNCFDLVFAWAIFEHVQDVPAVLREARRVVKPEGRIFTVVYPWFHCYTGSHLTDFIKEPYFHLTQSNEWTQNRLQEYVAAHPEAAAKVSRIRGEYLTLNRYSARMFLLAALDAGLVVERLHCHLDEEHAADAPETVPVADLIATGTTVLFHPAKRPLRKIESSRYIDPLPRRVRELEQQVADLKVELAAERALRDEFDEESYLKANPDVAQAVRNGALPSGRDHFLLYGKREKRRLH